MMVDATIEPVFRLAKSRCLPGVMAEEACDFTRLGIPILDGHFPVGGILGDWCSSG